MREKYIENQIKDVLKKQGNKVYFFKHAAGCTMPTGIPDIICVISGYSVWIEVKTPTGIQSEQQKVVQRNIENAGGLYWLCPSFNEFAAIWNNFVKKLKENK